MCEMPHGSASSKRSDAAALEEPAVATWTAWDSCRCGLDADGTFWIAPAPGQREGTAKGEKRKANVFTQFTRGVWLAQNKIHAVRVLGTVHLIGGVETLFWNFDSCVSMDLTGLDVSKVEDMSSMFEGCSSLERLDLSGWDTSRVEDMSSMFKDCNSLSTLNLTGWTVPKLRNLHEMFCNCSSLLALDVSCWDTSKVTDLSHTFFGCSSLSSLDLSGWDTSRAEDLAYMLFGCSSLRELRLGPAFSFRPCVSFSGYRTRQSSPPNPPMTPPYSGNWAMADGSCELGARKLALRYGPALAGTWVWAHGIPSGSPCADGTGSLPWSQDEDSKGQEPGSLRLGVYGLVRRLQRSEVSRFLSFELDPRDEADRSDAITLYLNGREGDFRVCVSSSLGWVSLKGERIWFVMDEHRDGLSYQDLQDDIVYGGALGEGAYGEMLDLLFEAACVLASATDVFHDEVADEQRLRAPDLNPFDDCSYDAYVRNEHAGPCTKILANIIFYLNCDVEDALVAASLGVGSDEAECELAAAERTFYDT